MDAFKLIAAKHWDGSSQKNISIPLILEEPLSIFVQGKSYSVVLRTPGDEIAHAAGFCFSEGIIDSVDDYTSIACCDADDPKMVSVALTDSRRKKIPHILERSGFISQTSCGLCGKEMVDEFFQNITPIPNNAPLNIDRVFGLFENLRDFQPLHKKTRASHAAVIYNSDFESIASAEDAGRHNALDKSIGKALLSNRLKQAALVLISSRISYELVQKAARARIPIICAISRPTELAMQMASKLNITLACLAKDSGLYIYSAPHRICATN